MRVSPLASSSRARRPLVRLRIQLPWYLRGLRYVVRPKVALAIGVAFLVGWELRSGRMQARFYSHLAQETDFRVEEGPSRSSDFPASGPYNERLGYARLPQFQDRLQDNGFVIARQARVSGRFLRVTGLGFYHIYKEKSRAGLQIQGRHGELLYSALQPGSTYSEFEDIPLIVVNTLLFIENREVLHPFSVYQNPAVEWDRLARAFLDLGIRQINPGYPVSGGSTLATQLEKIRYSPGGRTSGLQDKIRQMASASVRSYLDGEETVAARRRMVRE